MIHSDFKVSRSVWQFPEARSHQPSLHEMLKADTVVIGAGITGLLSALFLARAGKSVVLLEQGRIQDSESSRSTAHLTEVLDTRFHKLVSRFGLETMRRFTQAHRMAIHRLGALIEELEGPGGCGWKRLPGFLYSESETQSQSLRNELQVLNQLQIPAASIKSIPLPFTVAEALRIEEQAQLRPQELIQALLRELLSEEVQVFEDSRATEITPIGKTIRVKTLHGGVTAEHCIIATGSPALWPSVSHFEVSPSRTYAVAVKLRVAPKLDGLFWDTESPYHYLRMHGDLLLVGGEDHRTGNPQPDATSSLRRLEDYVRSRFQVDSVDCAWSGQILTSVDGLPLVGPSLRSDRIFYATGYSGNGISQGTLAAMLLSDAVLGKKDELMHVLSPHRLARPRDLPSFVKTNLVYPVNLVASFVARPAVERLRGENQRQRPDLSVGESRIGTVNGRRIASYCDENGVTRSVSARCTHLGGELSFNDFEKTWDCPCHGARFDLEGKVLCGPARENLKKLGSPAPMRVAAPAAPGKPKKSAKKKAA